MGAVRNYSNLPYSKTLTGAVTTTSTTLTVAGTAPLLADLPVPYTVVVDRGTVTEEVCLVTAESSTANVVTLTVTRAYGATPASAHVLGATIEHCLIAEDLDLIPDLTTEWVNTTPPAPTTGVTIFSRARARRLPAFVDPIGHDVQLQPNVFSNKISQISAINNSTTQTTEGLLVTHISGSGSTPTAVANASTNFFTGRVRYRCVTGAVLGSGAGTRSANAQWYLSSTANDGGFFFVARFGISTAVSGQRAFIGLSSTTAALAPGTEPSAFQNMIGFGVNSNQTNLFFLNNAASTATSTSLGANFPTGSSATYFYEVRMYAPPGNAANVSWSAQRLNDGQFASGAVATNLPAAGTLLAAHIHYTNGTVATAGAIDIQSLYVETDN